MIRHSKDDQTFETYQTFGTYYTLRILDTAEEEDYHAPKKSSEIYSNLKRTSTVTGEPKSEHKAEDVGKVKADIESSKIKQLIKNLGKD